MKAVVVHGRGDLRVEEVEDAVCGAGEVLVQMEWGGICGSDVAYWRSGASGTAVLTDPLVLGHEVAGRVAGIGPDAAGRLAGRGIDVGTPVTLHPATPVGEHEVPAELAERTNLWPEVRYFGSAAFRPHEQGGFSRFRAVRPEQLRVLPEGVSTKEAALAARAATLGQRRPPQASAPRRVRSLRHRHWPPNGRVPASAGRIAGAAAASIQSL